MFTATYPPSRAMPGPAGPAGPPAPRYDPDLDVIRDPRTGRFSCVYDAKHGRWRARVLKRIDLGMFDTDVDAARRVVSWYKSWYGPRWKAAWEARKRNPWRVQECTRKGVNGYVAEVFYWGLPVRVTRATALPGRPRPRRPAHVSRGAWAVMREADVWPTAAAARAAVKAVMRWELGLFYNMPLLVFWRA